MYTVTKEGLNSSITDISLRLFSVTEYIDRRFFLIFRVYKYFSAYYLSTVEV